MFQKSSNSGIAVIPAILVLTASVFFLGKSVMGLLPYLHDLKSKNLRKIEARSFMESILDYTTYAIQERWCVGPDFTNYTEIPWDKGGCGPKENQTASESKEHYKRFFVNGNNLERLLWSETALQEIAARYQQKVGESFAPSHFALSSFKIEVGKGYPVSLENFLGNFPVNQQSRLASKCLEKLTIEVNRPATVSKGDSVSLNIKLTAKTNKVCFKKESIEISALAVFYPRTLNTFGLVHTGDMDLSNFEEKNIQFHAPVYVGGNLIFPKEPISTDTIFRSKLILNATSRLKRLDGKKIDNYEPLSFGSSANNLWRHETFGGIMNGISMDFWQDKGVPNLFTINSTDPCGVSGQCSSWRRLKEKDPLKTKDSRLFMSKISDGKYLMGLSECNAFNEAPNKNFSSVKSVQLKGNKLEANGINYGSIYASDTYNTSYYTAEAKLIATVFDSKSNKNVQVDLANLFIPRKGLGNENFEARIEFDPSNFKYEINNRIKNDNNVDVAKFWSNTIYNSLIDIRTKCMISDPSRNITVYYNDGYKNDNDNDNDNDNEKGRGKDVGKEIGNVIDKLLGNGNNSQTDSKTVSVDCRPSACKLFIDNISNKSLNSQIADKLSNKSYNLSYDSSSCQNQQNSLNNEMNNLDSKVNSLQKAKLRIGTERKLSSEELKSNQMILTLNTENMPEGMKDFIFYFPFLVDYFGKNDDFSRCVTKQNPTSTTCYPGPNGILSEAIEDRLDEPNVEDQNVIKYNLSDKNVYVFRNSNTLKIESTMLRVPSSGPANSFGTGCQVNGTQPDNECKGFPKGIKKFASSFFESQVNFEKDICKSLEGTVDLDVDFSKNTFHSWLINLKQGVVTSGTTPQPDEVSPLEDYEIKEEKFNPTGGTPWSPPSMLWARVCRIESGTKVVTGNYVCEKLIIKDRSEPLKIAGTLIVDNLLVDTKQRIDLYSIFNDEGNRLFQDHKWLTPNHHQTCDEFFKNNPDCNKVWLLKAQRNQGKDTNLCMLPVQQCSSSYFLVNGIDNVNWTTLDPEIGIPEGYTETSSKIKGRYRRYLSRTISYSEVME